MALEKVKTEGSGGSSHKRRAPRADVKQGARKARRREDGEAEKAGEDGDAGEEG